MRVPARRRPAGPFRRSPGRRRTARGGSTSPAAGLLVWLPRRHAELRQELVELAREPFHHRGQADDLGLLGGVHRLLPRQFCQGFFARHARIGTQPDPSEKYPS
jgi:hypothetical protein